MSKPSFPKRVTIELTNDCNRECPECPRNKVNMEIGYITTKLFQTIIRQLPPDTTVVPFFRGESTLHPKFAEMMDSLGVFENVQFATNGDNLDNEDVADAILHNVTFFSLSLHEHKLPSDQQTQFLAAAKKQGIITQVSIVDKNLQGIDKQKFVDSWLQVADRVRIYREHSKQNIGDVSDIAVTCPESVPCNKPFEDMAVYWNGKVALCNHDWNEPYHLGDLNVDTIEQAYNGGGYQFVRLWHTTKRRRWAEPCRHCMFWIPPHLPNKMFGELYTIMEEIKN